MKKLSPAQSAKQKGMKSLAEFSRIVNVSTRTLDNMHKRNPRQFEALLFGAMCLKYVAGVE